MNGANVAGTAPRLSDSVAGTVPPTVPVVAVTGMSNACTWLSVLTNDTSREAPSASLLIVAALKGIETLPAPVPTSAVPELRIAPIISGAHGGVVPSVAAQALSP